MADNIQINSDRLAIEINFPGSVYRYSRFDWTGFIVQVTLDHQHTFCVPESYQASAGTGGSGLCNEFGIDQPIGYDEIGPGELFPKLGIGLLRRIDEKGYEFWCPYEVAQVFPTRVESSADRVVITQEPLDCHGYAARLVKTIKVEKNWLEISYCLENTGQKAIQTHEYVHNFVGINRQPLGPAYRLRFPYPVQFDAKTAVGLDNLDIQGNEIQFAPPEHGLYLRPQGYSLSNQPQWEMLLQDSGLRMQEIDDFAPLRVAIWGTWHVLSAEIFNPIDLQPGKTQKWARRFEFFD